MDINDALKAVAYALLVLFFVMGVAKVCGSFTDLGFFRDSQIVCDGYASVFQYLMLRSGLDCVMVLGSTVSKEAADL